MDNIITKRSADYWRGVLETAKQAGFSKLAIYGYEQLLAAAEAREAFPIPDTLPAVPENREAGESDSIKLAKLIDGMFYCEGGGYDSDDVREGIQKAFEIGVQSACKTEAITPASAWNWIKAEAYREAARLVDSCSAETLHREADRLTAEAEKEAANG